MEVFEARNVISYVLGVKSGWFLPELKGNNGEVCDAFRVCTVKMLCTNTTALMYTFTL